MKRCKPEVTEDFISELEDVKKEIKNPLDKGAYLDVVIDLLASMAIEGIPVEMPSGKMRKIHDERIFEYLYTEAHKYAQELAIQAMDGYEAGEEPTNEEPLN